MLSKAKYPMLSRADRRHPKRFADRVNATRGWPMASNFLLAGLLIRGGYTPKVNAEGAQV